MVWLTLGNKERVCSFWRKIVLFSAAWAPGKVLSHLQGGVPTHRSEGPTNCWHQAAPAPLVTPGSDPSFIRKRVRGRAPSPEQWVTWSRPPAPRPGIVAGAERPPAPQPQPLPPRSALLAVASRHPSFPGVPRPLARDCGRPSQIRLGGRRRPRPCLPGFFFLVTPLRGALAPPTRAGLGGKCKVLTAAWMLVEWA